MRTTFFVGLSLCFLTAIGPVHVSAAEPPVANPSPKSPASKKSKPTPSKPTVEAVADKEAMTDHERIKGSWYAMGCFDNGKMEFEDGPPKFVFHDDTMNGSEYVSWYSIDSTTSPKQFDVGTKWPDGEDGKPFRGIYKFEGENLILCLASSTDAPRPLLFSATSEDKRGLYMLRRAKPLPEAAVDVDFDADLLETIQQATKLLEDDKIAETLELLMPSEVFSALKQDDAKFQDAVKSFGRQHKNRFLNTFRILPKTQPRISQGGLRAADGFRDAKFDLTFVHVSAGESIRVTTFEKTDGRWHLPVEPPQW